jgi:hypothetical protein
MKRYIASLFMLVAAGCAVDEDANSQAGTGTASGPVPGGIPTFCKSDAECACWVFGECPEPEPEPQACKELDEAACLSRSDCVAVYNELSTAPIKPFVRCQDAQPAPVCTPEGATCSIPSSTADPDTCCAGLTCCGPALAEGGPSVCRTACPL